MKLKDRFILVYKGLSKCCSKFSWKNYLSIKMFCNRINLTFKLRFYMLLKYLVFSFSFWSLHSQRCFYFYHWEDRFVSKAYIQWRVQVKGKGSHSLLSGIFSVWILSLMVERICGNLRYLFLCRNLVCCFCFGDQLYQLLSLVLNVFYIYLLSVFFMRIWFHTFYPQ